MGRTESFLLLEGPVVRSRFLKAPLYSDTGLGAIILEQGLPLWADMGHQRQSRHGAGTLGQSGDYSLGQENWGEVAEGSDGKCDRRSWWALNDTGEFGLEQQRAC